MHIFLIRHDESIANVGENYEKRIPDHLVSLTERGKEQARENGVWLANYCKEKNVDLSKARIWRSPYLRTFLLRWFHYSPEWYQEERNPKNCRIREINGNTDMGYINKNRSTAKGE